MLDGVLKQAYKMFKVREKCVYWEREGWTNMFGLLSCSCLNRI